MLISDRRSLRPAAAAAITAKQQKVGRDSYKKGGGMLPYNDTSLNTNQTLKTPPCPKKTGLLLPSCSILKNFGSSQSIRFAWKLACFFSVVTHCLQLGRLLAFFPADEAEGILRMPSQFHRSLSSASQWLKNDVMTRQDHPQEHAILVPYRNRSLHLERFREYMFPYLQQNFPRDKFTIWVVEQADDKLFNKGWLANVGLKEIMKENPNIECVVFHDVDLLPETPTVPYNKCNRPIQLGSELSHFNFTIPYNISAGAVVSMSMTHWRTMNGLSNEYIGWGGEDDDIHERLRLNRLLNMSAGHIERPQRGRGRFVTINETCDHHARQIGRDTDHYLHNFELLELMKANSGRWKHDGLSNVLYQIVDKQIDPVDGVHHLKALPTSKGFRKPNNATETDVRLARKVAREKKEIAAKEAEEKLNETERLEQEFESILKSNQGQKKKKKKKLTPLESRKQARAKRYFRAKRAASIRDANLEGSEGQEQQQQQQRQQQQQQHEGPLQSNEEIVRIDAGSCVYSQRRDYMGPHLCVHAEDPSHGIRIMFDDRASDIAGPDARIYYARDVGGKSQGIDCKDAGELGFVRPENSSAINILWTEESTQHDTFLHDPKTMSHYSIYLSSDPRHKQGYVFENWGFDILAKRLEIPVFPASKRVSASAKDGALIVWAASNCNSLSKRLDYLKALHEHGAKVHSIGKCWNNYKVPSEISDDLELQRDLMGRTYKFWFAAENYLCDGYVSEKFWQAYAFGSVPILYGTSVHAEYAPSPDSFIDARNFDSAADLASFLLKIDADDEAYMKFHAWRTRDRSEWNPKFVQLFNRHRWGRESPKEPYAFVPAHRGQTEPWMCHVAAEVVRLRNFGLRNSRREELAGQSSPANWRRQRLEALPQCPDPEGEYSIPIA